MKKFITVAIPNYNHGHRLKKVIQSVIDQSLSSGKYEILVIDDGSTDNSKDILKSFGGKIKVIFQKNQGLSTTRGNLIKNASKKSTHLYFLDSDDIMTPNLLKMHYEFSMDEDLYVSADHQIWEETHKVKSTSLFAEKHPNKSIVYSTMTSKLWRMKDVVGIKWPPRIKNEDDYAIPIALGNRQLSFSSRAEGVLVYNEEGSLSKQVDKLNAIKLVDYCLRDWDYSERNISLLIHVVAFEGGFKHLKKEHHKLFNKKIPGFLVQTRYIGIKRAFADFWGRKFVT